MKSLTDTAKAILVKESDDPTPDRDAKLMTPNKATLRPGAGAVEGRFANPGANSPGEGEYEDLGPAAVNPTDVPPSAKAAGATKKDNSKSAQAAVPAEPSMMEEDIEISEELEAFIDQMMEEGYSEEQIAEAIAEQFEIVEEKEDDDDEDDEKEMDEELEAFIDQMMEEGYSEEQIAEAIAEHLDEEQLDEVSAKLLSRAKNKALRRAQYNDAESDLADEHPGILYPPGSSEKYSEKADRKWRQYDKFSSALEKRKKSTMKEHEEQLDEVSAKLLSRAKNKAVRAAQYYDAESDLADEHPGPLYPEGSGEKFSKKADRKWRQYDKFSSALEKRKKSTMKEHVNALLAGENLSEDFREKAETIFESAVTSRVQEEVSVLEEAYEKALEEEIANITDNLSEQIDSYLGYVVEEWMKENEIAIETGLRTEITEEFISGLKNLFAESYIDIPEEKVNITEELGKKVEELESKLNEQIEKNIGLTKDLMESRKFEIFVNHCDGLTDTQAEKLRTLAENIDATSPTEFEEKISVLKESYFPSSPTTKSAPLDLVEDVGNGNNAPIQGSLSAPMAAYVKSLDRSLTKKKE